MFERTLREPAHFNRVSQPPRVLRHRSFVQLINHYIRQDVVRVPAFLLLHAVLGVALAKSALLSTAHAGLVLLLGLWWVLAAPQLERAAYLTAYVAGAETLWRMTRALLPWEFSKYAICAILVLALLRSGKLRGGLLPFLFFVLLLPALVIPMANVDFAVLSDQTSFNLSGPLTLAISVWFFSQVKLDTAQLQRLLLALMGPVAGIAAVSLTGIVTAKELIFIDDSNPAMSGGFGPNQVSAVLGFGAVCCLLWAMDNTVGLALRALLCAFALYFMGQCALTFSRGGLYMAAGSICLIMIFLIRDRRTRVKALLGFGLLFLLANFVIVPRLNEFTKGALTKRFSDTRTSGREDLARADLQVFLENPIFGVGPGQTRHFRSNSILYHDAASHTEFTRLLSEHGLFGLAAMLVLMAMAVQHFLRARTPMNRALTSASIAWSFLFIASNAMRIALPSLLFGLSAATLIKLAGNGSAQPDSPRVRHAK
jgi:hypothetical protein